MNIPSSILPKLDSYQVEINGMKVKATVIDQADMIPTYVTELSSLLDQKRVVGLDVHNSTNSSYELRYPIRLMLCTKNRILVIQMNYIHKLPECLTKFLGDESICFVGSNIVNKLSIFRPRHPERSPKEFGVEAGYLAAKVMKKPSLEKCGLKELGGIVGINTSSLVGDECANATLWESFIRVFTEEEIKRAILNACTCYAIGYKLLAMV